MKQIDTKTLEKYEDKYIALTEQRTEILASGDTIKEVQLKLEKNKIEHAVIEYIPPLNVYLAPLCR